jgi:hypothetical protein
MRTLTRQKNRRNDYVPTGVELKETTVALTKQIDELPGVSEIKFMDIRGLKSIIALAIAAGYKREEVAAMAQMDPGDINAMVTEDDIKRAAREMPDAVIHAADQVVMRDLLTGHVDERTSRADLIAHRRRKLVLDARSDAREQRKEHAALTEKREQHYEQRFGVKREKEVEAEVIEDEDSQSK